MANRLFESLDELEEALMERCVALCGQAETIRSHTNYHWWPDEAQPQYVFNRNRHQWAGYASIDNLSLSGLVMSVPYPLRSQMAKVELGVHLKNHYERIAQPFEWNGTRADLDPLLANIHQHTPATVEAA